MLTRRDLLAAGLAAGGAAIFPAGAFGAPASPAKFFAGAGRADVIFPPELFPLDGFAGQLDPLAARVLLLHDGDTRLGIVVIDLTSISKDLIVRMKAIITEIAGVPADKAIVCASHTFSAPHVFAPGHTPPDTNGDANAAALGAFEAAVRVAATQAVLTLQSARLGFGLGTSRVNVSRDVETPHGWWLGADDAGYADHALGVLRIDRLDGSPLAILMNFAVQSSIMDGSQRAEGGKLISADLAGAAVRHIETHYGSGTVSMFLVGAAGDQAPYLQASRPVVKQDGSAMRADIHEAGFALVDLLGERLGSEAVRVAETIGADQAPALNMRRKSVEVVSQTFAPRNAPVGPVTAFSYERGAKVAVPVVLIRLGDIALAGVQPELAASIGARIKAGSPFPKTIVVTMVDGSAKYMPDAPSYDRFTYEARSSSFAQGAAETVASAIIGLLRQMKETGN